MNSIKKKIYLLVLFSLLIIGSYSCLTQKKASENKIENKKEIMEIKPTYKVSAHTKMFISQINTELKESKKGIEEYIPSEVLINNYNLRSKGDSFIVSGFIYTDEDFNNEKLDKPEININPSNGKIRTIHFDIKLLSEVLQTQGISYFEISMKAELKQAK